MTVSGLISQGETRAMVTEKWHSYVVHLAVLQREQGVQRHRSNEVAWNSGVVEGQGVGR